MRNVGRPVSGTLAVLAAGLLGGGGCSRPQAGTESQSGAVVPVVEVRLDSVRTGSIPEILVATGSTRALRQEAVCSPVEGPSGRR